MVDDRITLVGIDAREFQRHGRDLRCRSGDRQDKAVLAQHRIAEVVRTRIHAQVVFLIPDHDRRGIGVLLEIEPAENDLLVKGRIRLDVAAARLGQNAQIHLSDGERRRAVLVGVQVPRKRRAEPYRQVFHPVDQRDERLHIAPEVPDKADAVVGIVQIAVTDGHLFPVTVIRPEPPLAVAIARDDLEERGKIARDDDGIGRGGGAVRRGDCQGVGTRRRERDFRRAVFLAEEFAVPVVETHSHGAAAGGYQQVFRAVEVLERQRVAVGRDRPCVVTELPYPPCVHRRIVIEACV